MSNSCLIFMLIGPPAVGKSTTSRALAAHFPKSIHIPVDDIRTMVVSGLALPDAVWSAELVQQITLARKSVVSMALSYQEEGFSVVIDDFWDENHSSDYQDLHRQPSLHKILLLPRQEEAHRRNLNRSGDTPARAYIDGGIRTVYQQLKSALPQLLETGWKAIDTTDMSVAQTVAEIIRLSQVDT